LGFGANIWQSIASEDREELHARGRGRVDLQLKNQVSVLDEVESQLQGVIDAQKDLLQGFEASTDEYKQVSAHIRSEISDIAHAQGQSQHILDDIRQDVKSMGSRMQQAWDLNSDDPQYMGANKFRDLASKCMKTLFVTDPAVDRREIENRRDRLVESSCDWAIVRFDKFPEDETASRLWLHGDPGKGKTMIAMSFVDYMSQMVRGQDDQLMVYFFCDNTSDKRNTLSNVCKSLLYQILEKVLSHQNEDTTKFLRDLENKGDGIFDSVEAIWTILEEVLRWADLDKIYFIVDALDECDEASINNFLTLLVGDWSPSENANHSHQKVKWVLVSRNEPAIKDFLASAVSTMTIDLAAYEEDVRRSVEQFIEVKVDQLSILKRYDADLKAHVSETLRQKAQATFLWVSLACRELRSPRVRSINTKMVLQRLPAGLTRLYGRIYEQVLSNEFVEIVDYAKEILRSVTLAIRPLTLGELAVLADLPVSDCEKNFEQVEEYLEQCRSFLTVREEAASEGDSWETESTGSLDFEWGPELSTSSVSSDLLAGDEKTVHFVHQSAKDYLLSRPPHNSLFSSPECTVENEVLAIRCLNYVDRFTPRETLEKRGSDPEPRVFGILSSWRIHEFESVQPDEGATSENVFQNVGKKKVRWREPALAPQDYGRAPCTYTGWRHLYPLRYWINHGNLAADRMLANYNFESDLFRPQTLLSRTWVADFAPRIGSSGRGLVGRLGTINIFHAAVASGAIWVMSKMSELVPSLDSKCDLNYMCKDLPLMWPVEARVRKSVRYLLEQGADPNARHSDYGSYDTAIYLAAWLNPPALDDLLEFKADLDAKDEDGDTAFLTAIKKQELDIASELLQKGANINASDNDGFSALHHVAMRDNHETMSFLLEEGLDPNLSDKKGRTALHLLARFGSKATLKLLLLFGAEVDVTDELGFTPYSYAALYGKINVARYLANIGANVELEATERSVESNIADPWSDLPVASRQVAPKGCLRSPRAVFPEERASMREGVMPLKYSSRILNEELSRGTPPPPHAR
jgi:hypothetical protein